jgi:23S rRNA (cytidine1920-2'-O)/16S rRNA (cytidine1409-2'-O)-methyltransferase
LLCYNIPMKKIRLDILLVQRGLAESRSQAQRLIMAGQVRADGQVMLKPASSIAEEARLEVDQGPPFVSRGGEKLQAALDTFSIMVKDRICADIGASTGGFTDCLLQHGAQRVYAIDVGQGILHWKLRQDPRVVVMERTNARRLERLPERVSLVTVDASFISLKILLPAIIGWFDVAYINEERPKPIEIFQTNGDIVALIKPQFEAGRQAVSRGEGVIRDPAIHRQVLQDILTYAQQSGLSVRGIIRSPLQGPKGNTEFLAWLDLSGMPASEVESLISAVTPY